MTQYDLAIVGSGSAGVAAALEARGKGARVAVIEDHTLGGTCVNVGCVPSKVMLRAAEAKHLAERPRFPGVSSQGAALDFAEVMRQKDDLVAGLRKAKYQDVLEAAGVEILRGHARFTDAETLVVGDKPIRARAFLVATGADPVLPPIPGLAESEPWTYLDAVAAKSLPESLVVIGGGPIGLELAQAFARMGSRVTVIEAMPRILPAEDEALTERLSHYLKEEGIEILTSARVSGVERNGGYRVHTEAGVFEAERVLVATGRRPRTAGLGLEEAGVALEASGAIKVDERLATTNPRIFAAGDVAGLPQFVYVAAQSGRIAAKNALGATEPLDLNALPRVTFTDPALAAVGLTEREARERYGEGVRSAVLELSDLPRALAAFDTRGLFKIVVDAEGTVLGLHVLAPEAGDVLQEGIVAVKYELNYRDLIETFHPYLTLAEGVRLVAQALDTDVHQLSCCA